MYAGSVSCDNVTVRTVVKSSNNGGNNSEPMSKMSNVKITDVLVLVPGNENFGVDFVDHHLVKYSTKFDGPVGG